MQSIGGRRVCHQRLVSNDLQTTTWMVSATIRKIKYYRRTDLDHFISTILVHHSPHNKSFIAKIEIIKISLYPVHIFGREFLGFHG